MFKFLQDFTIVNKIFNVSGSEWSKIFSIWFLRLLYRTGFVIGWTVLVAMVVSRFGISSLPYLFVLNAVFTILGTFVFSRLWQRFSRSDLLISAIFVSGLLLFAAIFLYPVSELLFFFLLLFTIAVFLVQVKLALNSASEEMFNPLQSERVFPLLESSETIGGILGGFVVFILSSSIEVFTLVYLLIASLFAMIPLAFYCDHLNRKIKLLDEEPGESRKRFFSFSKFNLPKIQISYFKGLFLIIFLQWFIYNLLEFQYTKSVYQNVSSAILQAGSGFEHAFVHDLGALFMLFSVSALLIQLFLGSRIINYLGVISSMLLHGVVSLLSFLSFIFSFNFLTAVLVKNNFNISSVIFTNAYHSSYYALNEKFRDQAREFLEGIVRPIGAIAGTFVLIAFQRIFSDQLLVFAVNFILIVTSLFFIFAIYSQQKKYTKSAIGDLVSTSDRKVRMNAVDILAQKGHDFSPSVMQKILVNESDSISVRAKILKVLAESKSLESIPCILKCFESEKLSMRESALNALSAYEFSRINLPLYTKYEILCTLRKFYKRERNENLSIQIINLISELSGVAVLEFLLDILGNDKGVRQLEALFALSSYSDPDLIPVIEPYFLSGSPMAKLYAGIFLYKFPDYNKEILLFVTQLEDSGVAVEISQALFAIGELGIKSKKDFCVYMLKNTNSTVRVGAAVALLKMGYSEGLKVVLSVLFSKNYSLITILKRLLRNVDVRILKKIDKIILHLIHRELDEMIVGDCLHSKDSLKLKDLIYLKHLYTLAGEYEEVESLEKIIISNKNKI